MITKIREDVDRSDNNKDCRYSKTFALYTRQELEDWAKCRGFKTDNWGDFRIHTNIQCNPKIQSTLSFRFGQYHKEPTPSPDGTDWYYHLVMIDTSTWNYVSKPFFKDMAVDLDGLYELYRKKYEKDAAKYEKSLKDSKVDRRLQDIELNNAELELMTLADKYGFEYDSEYSSDQYIKNKNFTFKKGDYHLKFWGFAVKSKGIQCWEVYGRYPFLKYSYNVYVGTMDEIKQVAEGYMMMFQKPVLTSNYNKFKPKTIDKT